MCIEFRPMRTHKEVFGGFLELQTPIIDGGVNLKVRGLTGT